MPENPPALTLETATSDLGTFLVGQDGLTTYYFEADATPGVSVCEGDCLVAWPPVTVPPGNTVAAGDGANPMRPEGDGPMGPSRMLLSKPVIAAVAGHAVAFPDIDVASLPIDHPLGADAPRQLILDGTALRSPERTRKWVERAFRFWAGDGTRDVVRGGPGNDQLFGGDGNDTIIGGDGDDTIDGGIGDDYISGSGGDDTVLGGVGDSITFGLNWWWNDHARMQFNYIYGEIRDRDADNDESTPQPLNLVSGEYGIIGLRAMVDF